MSARPSADSIRRSRLRSSARARRGVTLVEVLVVIAIIALGGIAAMRFIGGAIFGKADAEGRAIALLSTDLGSGELPDLRPGGEAPRPDGGEEEQRDQCHGFFGCLAHHAGGAAEGLLGAAWDEVTGTVTGVKDFAVALFTDPQSIVDGAIETGQYIWNNPGEALKSLVWDDESSEAWARGDYAEAIGRTAWNVGSWAIPLKISKVSKLARVAGRLDNAVPDVPTDRAPDVPRDSTPDTDQDCPDGVCQVPGSCFAAGTLVFTEHGDRPIESIAPGDRVWSRDPSTGLLALRRVLATFVNESYVIDVELASATGREHLTVTPNHPFWVEGKGWVAAGELGEGAPLLAAGVSLVGHARVAWSGSTRVYNFEVEHDHTYFVGQSHAWVHNRGPDDCPPALDENGNFKDPELEARYQAYVRRNQARGRPVRDREEWKRESDYWTQDSPTARGNRFNATRRQEYDYNEVNLEDGTRVDSYDPVKGEIIERKASDFDSIEQSTFERYLDETLRKYPEGKRIRSNAYPDIDGQVLRGKHVLEVPDSNLTASNRAEFERIAREKGFEIRYVPE